MLAFLLLITVPNALAAEVTITRTEGQQFSGVVGSFTAGCPGEVVGPEKKFIRNCAKLNVAAEIAWGDGTKGAGTTSGGLEQGTCGPLPAEPTACSYTVSGTHTYSDEPGYAGTVSWKSSRFVGIKEEPLATGEFSFKATVSDGPLNVKLTLLQSGTSARVEPTVIDTAAGPSSHLSAKIEWGDGQTSNRTGPEGFTESHVYVQAPAKELVFNVKDDGEAHGVETARVNVIPPSSSGEPRLGYELTESAGEWTGSLGPVYPSYQWERCDGAGGSCSAINGAIHKGYTLIAADAGHTIRVEESVTSVSGGVSTAISAASPVASGGVTTVTSGGVTAVPGPDSVLRVVTPMPPRVEASMSWEFGWTRKYTLVRSLVVHALPAGGSVEVTCRGGGCPFADRHAGSHQASCHKHHKCTKRSNSDVDLTALFKNRRLHVGTHISVNVVKAGWVGKAFLFTTRANRTPREQTNCLAPGSSKPGQGC
jgi:hypothetical protein